MACQTMLYGMKFSITGTQNSHDIPQKLLCPIWWRDAIVMAYFVPYVNWLPKLPGQARKGYPQLFNIEKKFTHTGYHHSECISIKIQKVTFPHIFQRSWTGNVPGDVGMCCEWGLTSGRICLHRETYFKLIYLQIYRDIWMDKPWHKGRGLPSCWNPSHGN